MTPSASLPSVGAMNTHSKFFRPSAAVLAAGGLCWVVKFVVIAATDGATSGVPDLATAILYLTAVTLMAGGLAGLGAALLHDRHPVLRALGAVAGLVTWVVAYWAIESISQAVAGDRGPTWFSDEIGIVTTGAVLMTVGLLLLRRPEGSRPSVEGDLVVG